jgi:hypothetical protein
MCFWATIAFNLYGVSAKDEALKKHRENAARSKAPLTEQVISPHVVDGYKRKDLDELLPYQFSRFDSTNSSNSETITFRRRR